MHSCALEETRHWKLFLENVRGEKFTEVGMGERAIQRALVTKWHHAYFAKELAPSVQWVKNMIRDGVYSGEKIGGAWYIYVYAGTLEPVKPNDAPARSDEEKLATTGNALADAAMEDWLKAG